MFGTIVNTIAVIVGSLVGLLLKSRIKPEFGVGISKSLGIATLVIGINGVIANMFTVGADGSLSSSGELLLVISLAVGTLVGEMFHLDDHLQHFSSTVEQRFSIGGFATGFMNATLLFCVGAMTIVGALNDGISGDSSILLVKSALDGVSSIVLAASMGVGVLFSSLVVLIYQGGISLLSGLLQPVLMTGNLMSQLCMVGYGIIIAIGINFVATTRIKTLNMLPALLVPPLWMGIKSLIGMF